MLISVPVVVIYLTGASFSGRVWHFQLHSLSPHTRGQVGLHGKSLPRASPVHNSRLLQAMGAAGSFTHTGPAPNWGGLLCCSAGSRMLSSQPCHPALSLPGHCQGLRLHSSCGVCSVIAFSTTCDTGAAWNRRSTTPEIALHCSWQELLSLAFSAN